ncbi:hypothetical protein KC887_02370 [Candidatus Kaiserbacteria bacterium]|nr:hypothetical protein [Candidatus Kaiserbacteria bacterium]
MTDNNETKVTPQDIIDQAIASKPPRGEISPEMLHDAINAYNKFVIESRQFMDLLGTALAISSEPMRRACVVFNDILKENGYDTGVSDLPPIFEVVFQEDEEEVSDEDIPEGAVIVPEGEDVNV